MESSPSFSFSGASVKHLLKNCGFLIILKTLTTGGGRFLILSVESDLLATADFVLTLMLVTNDSVPSFNVSIFCPVALGSIEPYLLLPLSVFTKLYSLFSGFSSELLAEAFLL